MPLQLSAQLSTLTLLTLVLTLWALRSFYDRLHGLDLAGFSGPRVARDGQTSGGARGGGAGSCRMTWMSPRYLAIRPVQSRLASKYSLYLYREQPYDLEDQPSRSPVLFIPGNAGSFRQIRSIAAVTSATYFAPSEQEGYLARQHPGLDFFTLDFNDAFSAFHGQTMVEQAEFANDAVRAILALYRASRAVRNGHLPVPTSVLILSHSMGGIVARKMLTMPNYANQTVATIISLSSPHSLPALSFERGVERVYEQINTLWRQAYQQSRPGPLDDLLLVSISGGSSDTTVSADSSSLRSLAPGSHGLTVFTTGIPGVWTPIDHLAILWCNQLAAVLARALLEIAEPRSPSQAGPVARRLEILKAHLRLGHGLPPFFDRAGSPARSKFHIPASHPEPRRPGPPPPIPRRSD
ncbi:hypothetical protein PTTG_29801 [Puccinia triticina 1-1 BBBD Race 1]|uniref:GPI inositol-deacylase n=1 Tax=Puccinia triticina (isolate 1-1 / race 1 (BBBD)) TaxID=630390 RepID=A0A180G1V8_PUCT1|nr:hypothetical protein PTTG_29801 [Puccinia triticina 1-1 BBBD Race 1]